MAKFLLLLNEKPRELQKSTPEEMQAMFERYRAWGQSVREAGKMVGGHKLTEEGGRWMRPNGGGRIDVSDGPYAEAKEVLGGLYIIQAADYGEAEEIAKGCPHLGHGWIQVRQIDEM
jgi:hypothetical protein